MDTFWIVASPQNMVQWTLVDEHGAPKSSGSCALDDLADYAENFDGQKAKVLVGADFLYTRQVDLPAKVSMAKAEKVVKFIIEDDLLQNIDDVYATPLKRHDTHLDIAIGDDEKVQMLANQLNGLDIDVEGMYPLAYALPHEWFVYQEAGFCHVRTPERSFSAPTQSGWLILDMIYQQALEKPEAILFSHAPDVDMDISQMTLPLQEVGAQSIWALISDSIKHVPSLNKHLSSRPGLALNQKLLVINALVIVSIFLALTIGFKLNQLSHVNQVHQALQSDIESIYYGLYPNAKNLIAPKVRMEQEIKKAGKTIEDEFFQILRPLAKYIRGNSKVDVEDVQFIKGKLTLKLTAKDYQPIDTMVKSLGKELAVKQKDTTSLGDKLTATLEITRKAP